jgi:hypothetical protein
MNIGPGWNRTLIILVFLGWLGGFPVQPTLASPRPGAALEMGCDKPGWFPTNFHLKDHTVFHFDGFLYIMSIYLPGEKHFAYARSENGCDWEDLGPVLAERRPGGPDEMAIWAPFVYEEDGIFYAYYTGVTGDFTQRIMLASTDNPADPASWKEHGVVFQPDHPEAVWTAGEWADCRDAMVLKFKETYYMYYTGRDRGPDGAFGIIGLATADSPGGPWKDLGAILALPALSRPKFPRSVSFWAPFQPCAMPESPTVYAYQGFFYLFFNDTSQGEKYRTGASPSGPWSNSHAIGPGWAHEFWTAADSRTFTSYLTNYTITIAPVSWTPHTTPPRPMIGQEIYQLFLSMAFQP